MLGAATLATVALAFGGVAQVPGDGRFCPQPEPPRQTAIERYMEDRAGFGFRADEAYVRALIERGVWEYDVGYIPVTPRENRYLKLRDELTLGPAAERYLRRHRDLSGGVSVEDDWPRGPYLLVRLTRDAERHTRALRRLARMPQNLRTVQVARSYRQLRRLQDRISFEAHEGDGFHVVSSGPDIATNAVEIELITARTDHLAYFRARYGPGVRTTVIATTLTSPECAAATRFRASPDGLTLELFYGTGGGAELDRVEVVEHPDRVEVGIVEQGPNGPRTLELRTASAEIRLSRPLGQRAVIDMTEGRRVIPYDLCEPEPTPLRELIGQRREWGMRSDRAHVRRLLRAGSGYTLPERAWIRRVNRLEPIVQAVDIYGDRHARAFAGVRVVADYPARAGVRAFFTRDTARHAAALRRRIPDPARLGVTRGPRTDRALERVRRRVWRAARRGAADPFAPGGGFLVRSAEKDPARGVVVLRLLTRRTDHAAWFARFGPVRTVVEGRGACPPGPPALLPLSSG